MDRYVVVDRSAKMPTSVRSRYRRVGVVELKDPTQDVRMLSERDRNVLRVVETWERLHAGSTMRSVYRQALALAQALADKLNREDRHAAMATHVAQVVGDLTKELRDVR